MLDHVVTDIELRNAVLRNWREQPRACVAAASLCQEQPHHPLHVPPSTAVSDGAFDIDAFDVDAFDVGPIRYADVSDLDAMFPNGAASTAVAEHVKSGAHVDL